MEELRLIDVVKKGLGSNDKSEVYELTEIKEFDYDIFKEKPYFKYYCREGKQRYIKKPMGAEAILYKAHIAEYRPSNWPKSLVEEIVGYKRDLYQKCHIIGECLGGAYIVENIFAGTSTLNTTVMNHIEKAVKNYSFKRKVFYKVTLYYLSDNLVCDYLVIEAIPEIFDDSSDIGIRVKIFNK